MANRAIEPALPVEEETSEELEELLLLELQAMNINESTDSVIIFFITYLLLQQRLLLCQNHNHDDNNNFHQNSDKGYR